MEDGKGNEPSGYVALRGNRRKNFRKQILVLRVSAGDKGAFFGYGKTISRDGMFITSVNPRKLGEEFEISFRLPAVGTQIRSKCSVIWRREYDPKLKHEPGMGLKFVDLTTEMRDKIDEWVKSSESSGKKVF
ncbi:MAG: PilZ domain-containing protein [Deltaproteobacteria bacterium]|nr:PilZ domain-containing protein [Deltaproteobacteria bacterium]